MTNYFLPLQPDTFYHIYNRGNNSGLLFYKEENYRYFLRKFGGYLITYADGYAYSLLPNHFHFLLKIKALPDIEYHERFLPTGKTLLDELPAILSEEFRRFFLSYAKSIKIQEGRTGSLFEKNFRRREVPLARLKDLVRYIHYKPQLLGLTADFKTYPHSSYHSLLSEAKTRLKRQQVFELFGGKENFISEHLTPVVLEEELRLE